jgi:hypothetical protein
VDLVTVNEGIDASQSLTLLRKIYIVVHPFYWVDFPDDDPRREGEHAQQFPGRWELTLRPLSR